MESLALTNARLSWLSSTLNVNINAESLELLRIAAEARQGRLEVAAFSTLSNTSIFNCITNEDTEILTILEGSEDASFVLHFTVTERAKDTKIFSIDAFNHYRDLTQTPPVLEEYCGPKFVLNELNKTGNCYKGYEKFNSIITYETCNEQDDYDKNLEKCCPILYATEADVKQMKETSQTREVYCFPGTYRVENQELNCPTRHFQRAYELDTVC